MIEGLPRPLLWTEIKDFEKLMESLEEAGWHPMVCDTPIPFFDNEVPCGVPNGVGDVAKEVRMVPRDMLSGFKDYTVKARGSSMKDAGIDDGDTLQVVTDMPASDGDIVLAWLDGDYTVKTYCEDKGGHPWLVPQNEDYNPIRMEDYDDAWIAGVVTRIIKRAPRVSFRSCMKIIERAQQQEPQEQSLSPVQVSRAIQGVAASVKVARQWYSVYRVLVDCKVVREEDYVGFCDRVRAEVPEHLHLPVYDEIARMAVQSFRKPVAMWNEVNAPVQGKRFKEYLIIAERMQELLEES